MSIAMDAKYIYNLILNAEVFKMTNQNYGVNAETMEYIYLSRSILGEKGWGFNMIADSRKVYKNSEGEW